MRRGRTCNSQGHISHAYLPSRVKQKPYFHFPVEESNAEPSEERKKWDAAIQELEEIKKQARIHHSVRPEVGHAVVREKVTLLGGFTAFAELVPDVVCFLLVISYVFLMPVSCRCQTGSDGDSDSHAACARLPTRPHQRPRRFTCPTRSTTIIDSSSSACSIRSSRRDFSSWRGETSTDEPTSSRRSKTKNVSLILWPSFRGLPFSTRA